MEPVKVDVRIIAATNEELAELLREGRFREDVLYRTRVIHLRLPGLCDRRRDIPLLVDRLVAKFNRLQGKSIAGVADDVMGRLMERGYKRAAHELGIDPSTLYRKMRVLDLEAPTTDGRSRQR